jgi:hypothetical protein
MLVSRRTKLLNIKKAEAPLRAYAYLIASMGARTGVSDCVGLLNTVCCRGSCGTRRRCMIGAVFGYSFALLACAFLYLCSNSLNSALRIGSH